MIFDRIEEIAKYYADHTAKETAEFFGVTADDVYQTLKAHPNYYGKRRTKYSDQKEEVISYIKEYYPQKNFNEIAQHFNIPDRTVRNWGENINITGKLKKDILKRPIKYDVIPLTSPQIELSNPKPETTPQKKIFLIASEDPEQLLKMMRGILDG